MTKQAKQKGRLGQQEIRDRLLEMFPEFEPDDIKSTTIYGFIEQASRHSDQEPVVFFRSDRKPWVVMVGLDHYMELLRRWKIDN